jgi:protein-L-isoaspartate(D-aspartate) O-methyltransferase
MEERQGLVTALRAEGIDDPAVIAALTRVPRHRFVPEAYRDEAYANRPLPIGSGQTISQPFIVAAMTQSVSPKPNDVCLEIGTGSGYQAAVLAEICRKVYSIEYLPEVARFGERNLRGVGYEPERVELRVGDGYKGWPEHAPFDVIVVTAAPEQVPKPLLDQLRVGGRLVIPVGPEDGVQELELWVRRAPGDGVDAFERKTLMGVRFVPFLGDAGRE